MGAGRGRYARQDHHDRDARLDPGGRRPRSGFPDRGRAGELRRVGAAHRLRLLRDRGRRVRHRLLRQALQVRALPSAHGNPQQPGVRPRGHLPRPRGHRDPVPPSGAHRPRQRADRCQRASKPASNGCWRAAAGRRWSAFGVEAGWHAGTAGSRRQLRREAGGQAAGHGALGPARQPQSAQRAGRAGGRPPRGRAGAAGDRRPRSASAT